MLTTNLYIKTCSDNELLNKYISEYTNMFYKLYNNPELLNNRDFFESKINEYIDKSIYDFCAKDVLTKLNLHKITVKKREKEILDIDDYLSSTSFISKKDKYKKYKLINKLNRLRRTKDNNIVFGSKNLLQNITKLSQNKDKTEEQNILLKKYKKKFKEKRILGIYLIGRACEGGNRKIDFDLDNNKIIFKPNRTSKIEIVFNETDKKQKLLLSKLQEFASNNLMPLTVRITNSKIHISYDEEFINGYSFNEIDCRKEQKDCLLDEDKKQIYIKHKKEQYERKSIGKIENRYISIDLNPMYIGISIFDSDEFNNQKIITNELIDLSDLSSNLRLSSNHIKKIKQNNKRKHEIKEVWKYIFDMVEHYKI